MSFIPIKGNRILLFAKYEGLTYQHLSIHEIRSNNRVGRTLWSFNGNIDDCFHDFLWEPIKSTENALGVTFRRWFDGHWKLFDISTTETDTSDISPLIESGIMDFDLKIEELKVLGEHGHLGLSEFFAMLNLL